MSEPVIGRIGKIRNTIAQTPTISAAAIYAAGDAVGGLLTFAMAGRMAGGTGQVETIVIIDDDQEQAQLNLVLFNQTFTPTADNAPFNPSDADLENCVGHVAIPAANYINFVANCEATVNTALSYESVDGNLYGQLVVAAGGAPTYTAVTDLTVKVTFVED